MDFNDSGDVAFYASFTTGSGGTAAIRGNPTLGSLSIVVRGVRTWCPVETTVVSTAGRQPSAQRILAKTPGVLGVWPFAPPGRGC